MLILIAAITYCAIRFAAPGIRALVARRKAEPAMIALRIPIARPDSGAAGDALQRLRVRAHRAWLRERRRDDRVRLRVPGERSALPGA